MLISGAKSSVLAFPRFSPLRVVASFTSRYWRTDECRNHKTAITGITCLLNSFINIRPASTKELAYYSSLKVL
jgi:hypothetical protein